MIDRLEVTPGPGTVIRFGAILSWAGPTASVALVSFLSQSARNLGPSSDGGRRITDHLAGILNEHDPEPDAAFAVVGPSGRDWDVLLHGAVQARDGSRWLYPSPKARWVRYQIPLGVTFSLTGAGFNLPKPSPGAVLNLEAGAVPGGGFLLVAEARIPPVGTPGPTAADAVAGAGAGADGGDRIPVAATPLTPSRAVPLAVGAGVEVLAGAPTASPRPARGVPALAVVPAVTTRQQPDVPPRRGPGPEGALYVEDLRVTDPSVGQPPLAHMARLVPAIAEAPTVSGELCERGHLNRPGVDDCAVCRRSIARRTGRSSGTRPPLGCLVTDDSMVFRLDCGYLIGSDPAPDPTVRRGLALPLVLTGRHVAAAHAEVRLHDWDVAITDRDSPGGTRVYEPGSGEWVLLAPYEPRILRSSTHATFGGRMVTFVTPWDQTSPGEPRDARSAVGGAG